MDKICKRNEQSVKVTKRQIAPDTLQSIKHELSLIDWQLLKTLGTEESFKYFTSTLNATIDKYAPLALVTKTASHRKIAHEPWMTPGLLKVLYHT